MAAEPARRGLPWHLLEALSSLSSSRSNARRSADEIERAVAERRAVVAGLDGRGPVPEGGLVALSRSECLQLLAGRVIGRLAFVYRGEVPLIVPVNYVLADDAVLIRSGPGPKMQAVERGAVVSFAVDDLDEESHSGWSVVVTGRAERVRGPERQAEPQPEPWAPGPRSHLIRIPLDRVDGRWLRPARDPSA